MKRMIDDSVLTDIADVIREKNGTDNKYEDVEMAQAVRNIPSPKEEQEKTIDITENGTYDVLPDENKALSKVTVNTNIKSLELLQYATFLNGFMLNKAVFPDDIAENIYFKIRGHSDTAFVINLSRMFAESNVKNITIYIEEIPSSGVSYNNAFTRCQQLQTIVFANETMPLHDANNAFAVCTELKQIIGLIDLTNAVNIGDMFAGSPLLEDVRFVGEIKSTFKIQSCKFLTVESAKSIITHLVNYTGTENEFVYSVLFADSVWELLNAEGATAPGNITWEEYVNSIGWNK